MDTSSESKRTSDGIPVTPQPPKSPVPTSESPRRAMMPIAAAMTTSFDDGFEEADNGSSNPSSITKDGAQRPDRKAVIQAMKTTLHAMEADTKMVMSKDFETLLMKTSKLDESIPSATPSLSPQRTASVMGRTASAQRMRTESNVGSVSDSSTHLLQPFVSRLAAATVHQLESDGGKETLEVEGSVLFVDLSGYSSVVTAMAKEGASALSQAVNGYFRLIVDCILRWGGDVQTFAGDAVVACFIEAEVGASAVRAAGCAAELQREHGHFGVTSNASAEGLAFRLHIAIACGRVSSTVYTNPGAKSMQTHFHVVTGPPLLEVNAMVDLAKPGETSIGEKVIAVLLESEYVHSLEVGDLAKAAGEASSRSEAKSLKSISIDQNAIDELFYRKTLGEENENAADISKVRSASTFSYDPSGTVVSHDLAKHFIHPAIARIAKTKTNLSLVAELRPVTILFIGKDPDDDLSISEWFSELGSVLDRWQCPVLQLIDDDKGVHVLAALSLVHIDRDAGSTALRICKELIEREVSFFAGIASGRTFCGVTGSNVACRWDVTGTAVVRACRLMQLAIKIATAEVDDETRPDVGSPVSRLATDGSLNFGPPKKKTRVFLNVIADDSVYHSADKAMLVKAGETHLKGETGVVTYYALKEGGMHLLKMLPVETGPGIGHLAYHTKELKFIRDGLERSAMERQASHQTGMPHRAAIILHGPSGFGKATIAARSAFSVDVIPFVHNTEFQAAPLSVAWTIVEWFRHHPLSSVVKMAGEIVPLLEKQHYLAALRAVVDLVVHVILQRGSYAIIVKNAQYLDEQSFTLLKRLAQPPERKYKKGGTIHCAMFYVYFTVSPLHNVRTWRQIAAMFDQKAIVVEVPASVVELPHFLFEMRFRSSFALVQELSQLYSHGNLEVQRSLEDYCSALKLYRTDVFSTMTFAQKEYVAGLGIAPFDCCPSAYLKAIEQYDHLTVDLRIVVTFIAASVEYGKRFGVKFDHLIAAIKSWASSAPEEDVAGDGYGGRTGVQTLRWTEGSIESRVRQLIDLHVIRTKSNDGSLAAVLSPLYDTAEHSTLNGQTFLHLVHPFLSTVVVEAATPAMKKTVSFHLARTLKDHHTHPEVDFVWYLRLCYHLFDAGLLHEAKRTLTEVWIGCVKGMEKAIANTPEEYRVYASKTIEFQTAMVRDRLKMKSVLDGIKPKPDGIPEPGYDGYTYNPYPDSPSAAFYASYEPPYALGPLRYFISAVLHTMQSLEYLVNNGHGIPQAYLSEIYSLKSETTKVLLWAHLEVLAVEGGNDAVRENANAVEKVQDYCNEFMEGLLDVPKKFDCRAVQRFASAALSLSQLANKAIACAASAAAVDFAPRVDAASTTSFTESQPIGRARYLLYRNEVDGSTTMPPTEDGVTRCLLSLGMSGWRAHCNQLTPTTIRDDIINGKLTTSEFEAFLWLSSRAEAAQAAGKLPVLRLPDVRIIQPKAFKPRPASYFMDYDREEIPDDVPEVCLASFKSKTLAMVIE